MPRRLIALLALVSCSPSTPERAAPPPPVRPPSPSDLCSDIGRHEHELFAPMRAQQIEQARAAGLTVRPNGDVVTSGSGGPNMRAWPREVSQTSCSDDSWPVAVQRCLVAAANPDAWSRCLDTLSPPLRARHDHRVDGIEP